MYFINVMNKNYHLYREDGSITDLVVSRRTDENGNKRFDIFQVAYPEQTLIMTCHTLQTAKKKAIWLLGELGL